MGNKKLFKYIGNVVLVIALLAAVVTLNVAVQKNTSSAEIASSERTKKLSLMSRLSMRIGLLRLTRKSIILELAMSKI